MINRKYLTIIIIVLIGLPFKVISQINFYTGFEKDVEDYYPYTKTDDALYMSDLQRPQFIQGIKGRALDLSKNAVLRKPLILSKDKELSYDKDNSLSVSIWVKTLPNAPLGTVIAGNKATGAFKKKGWLIFSQESGAWGVNLSDGKRVYTYAPTYPRQAINDGDWHHLSFCLDRKKGEVWFYFDGINVAIYNTSGLGSLEGEKSTVIGGTDEYIEHGSEGQWTAFNGFLDEVKIESKYKTPYDIRSEYLQYRKLLKSETCIAPIRIMAWNIWHGGRRYGKHVGVNRVIETIKKAKPDIVGLIETYGSGATIADSLGYHFYLISDNLSIMSRFPIKKTIKAFKSFNFGGAVLDLGNNRELVFLDTWLHYLPNYCKNTKEQKMTVKELIQDESKTRHKEIKAILSEIKPILKNSEQIPVVMSGDFNSGSHLDWIADTKKIHYGYEVEWPVSKEMINAGFKDSYRELHINPLLDPGLTWTPRAAKSSSKYGLRDRIDYIYYHGNLLPIESRVIDSHPIMFPSDHAAVITVFDEIK